MSGEMIDAILDRIMETTDYYNYKARDARTARAELNALRQRVAELESERNTLQTRKCVEGRECYSRGWMSAIEAAANCADNCDLPYEASGGTEWSSQVSRRATTSDAIRALTPPSCDCQPLKPPEHYADDDLYSEFLRGIDAAWDAAYVSGASKEILIAIKSVVISQ